MTTSESFSFEAIGTHWEIDVNLEKSRLSFVRDLIQNRINEFDRNYSRFRKDSLITLISTKKGIYTMPDDFAHLFQVYENLYQITQGLFTPLIGSALASLGYDADYSLEEKPSDVPLPLEDVLSFHKNNLTVRKPVLLDFGAGGKGYLVDIIGKLLQDEGVDEFLINAGGDILHHSRLQHTARIGLENPLNISQVIGTIDIMNVSLCGSAGNRRKWGEYHHIINPKTLQSPKNILGVWVVASSTFIADCMTTVLYLDQSEKAKQAYSCEYFILYADMTFEQSTNFSAELFLK